MLPNSKFIRFSDKGKQKLGYGINIENFACLNRMHNHYDPTILICQFDASQFTIVWILYFFLQILVWFSYPNSVHLPDLIKFVHKLVNLKLGNSTRHSKHQPLLLLLKTHFPVCRVWPFLPIYSVENCQSSTKFNIVYHYMDFNTWTKKKWGVVAKE